MKNPNVPAILVSKPGDQCENDCACDDSIDKPTFEWVRDEPNKSPSGTRMFIAGIIIWLVILVIGLLLR